MAASNYVHLEVDEVIKESDKAFLVSIDGEEHWIPKSQVADADNYAEGDCGCTMSVTKFIADKHGLGE